MSRIDDETLAAYLDGELDAEEARRVAALLEEDPALRARLAAWEENDRAVRLALMAASERVPEAAVSAILAATQEKAAPASPAARGRWRDRFARLFSAPALAAATAALVIGILVGTMVTGERLRFSGTASEEPAAGTLLLAGGPLAAGLEGLPSGRTRLIAEAGKRLTPVATYRARDGHWCREFRLEPAAVGEPGDAHRRATALAGLACRRAGRWAVVALAPLPHAAPAPGAIYRPAGDESLPRELARQMRRLGLDTPLDGERERRLLASGWSQPAR